MRLKSIENFVDPRLRVSINKIALRDIPFFNTSISPSSPKLNKTIPRLKINQNKPISIAETIKRKVISITLQTNKQKTIDFVINNDLFDKNSISKKFDLKLFVKKLEAIEPEKYEIITSHNNWKEILKSSAQSPKEEGSFIDDLLTFKPGTIKEFKGAYDNNELFKSMFHNTLKSKNWHYGNILSSIDDCEILYKHYPYKELIQEFSKRSTKESEFIFLMHNIIKNIKKPEQINATLELATKLISAKTPNQSFIFKNNSSYNNETNGFYALLKSFNCSKNKFENLFALFEHAKNGEISSYCINNFSPTSEISPLIIEDLKNIKNPIKSFKTKKAALENAQDAEVVKIKDKLYSKFQNKLHPLFMDEKTFLELFKPINRFAFAQHELFNCYFLSAVNDFLHNPKTRIQIYQMFKQEGNDILVKTPSMKGVLRFKDKQLKKGETAEGPLWLKMLERTFSVVTAKSFKLPAIPKITNKGVSSMAYEFLGGKENLKVYQTKKGPTGILRINTKISKLEIDKIKKENANNPKKDIKILSVAKFRTNSHELNLAKENKLFKEKKLKEILKQMDDDTLMSIKSKKCRDAIMSNHAYSITSDGYYIDPFNSIQLIKNPIKAFNRNFTSVSTFQTKKIKFKKDFNE